MGLEHEQDSLVLSFVKLDLKLLYITKNGNILQRVTTPVRILRYRPC